MDRIEQAVFTSAETDRQAGYQVVATSPGLCEADLRELAVWCPSHDGLLESGAGAVSVNFHSLPSGHHCISRTTPAGWEYSGRGGPRIYTQCLIVPPEVLARFSNNPFSLLRAAVAGGALRIYRDVPKQLEPLRLAGRAAVVDTALLARLSAHPGPDWLASLVQAALGSSRVALASGPPAEHLIAGLINCLPPECRTGFSFSTALKFSPRRPFRIVALAADREEQRRVCRLYDVVVLDFSGSPPAEFAPIDSWPRFIQRVLKSGGTSLLASRLLDHEGELALDDLPALGLQLLEELDASALDHPPSEDAPDDGDVPDAGVPEAQGKRGKGEGGTQKADETDGKLPIDNRKLRIGERQDQIELQSANSNLQFPICSSQSAVPSSPVPPPSSPAPAACNRLPEAPPAAEVLQQAHRAHRRFKADMGRAAVSRFRGSSPSQLIDPDDPQVVATLEQLDDLVYDAIAGQDAALDQLKSFWPQARRQLGPDLLLESQEQYLRYALSIWEECVQAETVRNPLRALRSLEVLCLLFDGK